MTKHHNYAMDSKQETGSEGNNCSIFALCFSLASFRSGEREKRASEDVPSPLRASKFLLLLLLKITGK